MHMIFTEEEKRWIVVNKFGWPIKSGCPSKIKKSIEKKKNEIKNQFKGGAANG